MWTTFKKLISVAVCVAFTLTSVTQPASASLVPALTLSAPSRPTLLTGLAFEAAQPLQFDFIVNLSPDSSLQDGSEDFQKHIRYFLTGLTLPEGDIWVNLSPLEKDRMISDTLGRTQLGQELLAQDYLLKRLTASLHHPDSEVGRRFWDEVYRRAYERYGTTDIPTDTVNKVWIAPGRAAVYVDSAVSPERRVAYVTEASLKVMIDEDYAASRKGQDPVNHAGQFTREVMREVLVPVIEKEVNEGRHFASVRQIYNALVLAAWYKQQLRETIIAQSYADKQKISGVTGDEPAVNERVYESYLQSVREGIVNFIREEPDPSGELIPRRYFSGGLSMAGVGRSIAYVDGQDQAMKAAGEGLKARLVRTAIVFLNKGQRIPAPNGGDQWLEDILTSGGTNIRRASVRRFIKDVRELQTALTLGSLSADALDTSDYRKVLEVEREFTRAHDRLQASINAFRRDLKAPGSALDQVLASYQDLVRQKFETGREHFALYLQTIWRNKSTGPDFEKNETLANSVWARKRGGVWLKIHNDLQALYRRSAGPDGIVRDDPGYALKHGRLKEGLRRELEDFFTRQMPEFFSLYGLAPLLQAQALNRSEDDQLWDEVRAWYQSQYLNIKDAEGWAASGLGRKGRPTEPWVRDLVFRMHAGRLPPALHAKLNAAIAAELGPNLRRTKNRRETKRLARLMSVSLAGGLAVTGLGLWFNGEREASRGGSRQALQAAGQQAGRADEKPPAPVTPALITSLLDQNIITAEEITNATTVAEVSAQARQQLREVEAALAVAQTKMTEVSNKVEKAITQASEKAAAAVEPIAQRPIDSSRVTQMEQQKEEDQKALGGDFSKAPAAPQNAEFKGTSFFDLLKIALGGDGKTSVPEEISRDLSFGSDLTAGQGKLIATVEGPQQYLSAGYASRYNPRSGRFSDEEGITKSGLASLGKGSPTATVTQRADTKAVIALVGLDEVITEVSLPSSSGAKLLDVIYSPNGRKILVFDKAPGRVRLGLRPAHPGELDTASEDFHFVRDDGTPMSDDEFKTALKEIWPGELVDFIWSSRELPIEQREEIFNRIMNRKIFAYSYLELGFKQLNAKCDGHALAYAALRAALKLDIKGVASGYLVKGGAVYANSAHAWPVTDQGDVEATAFAGYQSSLPEYVEAGGVVSKDDLETERQAILQRAADISSSIDDVVAELDAFTEGKALEAKAAQIQRELSVPAPFARYQAEGQIFNKAFVKASQVADNIRAMKGRLTVEMAVKLIEQMQQVVNSASENELDKQGRLLLSATGLGALREIIAEPGGIKTAEGWDLSLDDRRALDARIVERFQFSWASSPRDFHPGVNVSDFILTQRDTGTGSVTNVVFDTGNTSSQQNPVSQHGTTAVDLVTGESVELRNASDTIYDHVPGAWIVRGTNSFYFLGKNAEGYERNQSGLAEIPRMNIGDALMRFDDIRFVRHPFQNGEWLLEVKQRDWVQYFGPVARKAGVEGSPNFQDPYQTTLYQNGEILFQDGASIGSVNQYFGDLARTLGIHEDVAETHAAYRWNPLFDTPAGYNGIGFRTTDNKLVWTRGLLGTRGLSGSQQFGGTGVEGLWFKDVKFTGPGRAYVFSGGRWAWVVSTDSGNRIYGKGIPREVSEMNVGLNGSVFEDEKGNIILGASQDNKRSIPLSISPAGQVSRLKPDYEFSRKMITTGLSPQFFTMITDAGPVWVSVALEGENSHWSFGGPGSLIIGDVIRQIVQGLPENVTHWKLSFKGSLKTGHWLVEVLTSMGETFIAGPVVETGVRLPQVPLGIRTPTEVVGSEWFYTEEEPAPVGLRIKGSWPEKVNFYGLYSGLKVVVPPVFAHDPGTRQREPGEYIFVHEDANGQAVAGPIAERLGLAGLYFKSVRIQDDGKGYLALSYILHSDPSDREETIVLTPGMNFPTFLRARAGILTDAQGERDSLMEPVVRSVALSIISKLDKEEAYRHIKASHDPNDQRTEDERFEFRGKTADALALVRRMSSDPEARRKLDAVVSSVKSHMEEWVLILAADEPQAFKDFITLLKSNGYAYLIPDLMRVSLDVTDRLGLAGIAIPEAFTNIFDAESAVKAWKDYVDYWTDSAPEEIRVIGRSQTTDRLNQKALEQLRAVNRLVTTEAFSLSSRKGNLPAAREAVDRLLKAHELMQGFFALNQFERSLMVADIAPQAEFLHQQVPGIEAPFRVEGIDTAAYRMSLRIRNYYLGLPLVTKYSGDEENRRWKRYDDALYKATGGGLSDVVEITGDTTNALKAAVKEVAGGVLRRYIGQDDKGFAIYEVIRIGEPANNQQRGWKISHDLARDLSTDALFWMVAAALLMSAIKLKYGPGFARDGYYTLDKNGLRSLNVNKLLDDLTQGLPPGQGGVEGALELIREILTEAPEMTPLLQGRIKAALEPLEEWQRDMFIALMTLPFQPTVEEADSFWKYRVPFFTPPEDRNRIAMIRDVARLVDRLQAAGRGEEQEAVGSFWQSISGIVRKYYTLTRQSSGAIEYDQLQKRALQYAASSRSIWRDSMEVSQRHDGVPVGPSTPSMDIELRGYAVGDDAKYIYAPSMWNDAVPVQVRQMKQGREINAALVVVNLMPRTDETDADAWARDVEVVMKGLYAEHVSRMSLSREGNVRMRAVHLIIADSDGQPVVRLLDDKKLRALSSKRYTEFTKLFLQALEPYYKESVRNAGSINRVRVDSTGAIYRLSGENSVEHVDRIAASFSFQDDLRRALMGVIKSLGAKRSNLIVGGLGPEDFVTLRELGLNRALVADGTDGKLHNILKAIKERPVTSKATTDKAQVGGIDLNINEVDVESSAESLPDRRPAAIDLSSLPPFDGVAGEILSVEPIADLPAFLHVK